MRLGGASYMGPTNDEDALALKLFSKIVSFRSALSAIAMAFALPACAQVAPKPARDPAPEKAS